MAQNDPIVAAMKQPLGRSERGLLRLGLVLNGTVSAGAWTAGALDALIEALDAWHELKQADPSTSQHQHQVRLEIVGGASGGAVCAAIFAKAVLSDFPHGPHEDNPFWMVWGKGLSLSEMLDPADGEGAEFPNASFLSGRAILRAAQAVVDWKGRPREQPRAWLAADGLRILMTQTNLRGVPYAIPLRPEASGAKRPPTRYFSHADYVSFALAKCKAVRPDEFPLDADCASHWERLAAHARASGAFPGGFPPVRLTRPAIHYEWRGVSLPGPPDENGVRAAAQPGRLRPNWAEGDLSGDEYEYDAVDGGVLNNSPFALVHGRMAGLGKGLPRDELSPRAAIIVMDPLAAAAEQPAQALLDPSARLTDVVGRLLPALVAHGRFTSSEIMLASEETLASRHLFTAGRRRRDGTEAWGEAALASSGLGAFIGFLDESIRRHDFLLGRSNMRAWLRRHFQFDAGSDLFTNAQPKALGRKQSVIPLVPSAGVKDEPVWPTHPDCCALEKRLRARMREVARRQGVWAPLARWPIGPCLANTLHGRLAHALRDLAERN